MNDTLLIEVHPYRVKYKGEKEFKKLFSAVIIDTLTEEAVSHAFEFPTREKALLWANRRKEAICLKAQK